METFGTLLLWRCTLTILSTLMLPILSLLCVYDLQLRTVCYNLLGLACRQGVLYVAVSPDKVQDVIINGLLAGLEYVENRHVECCLVYRIQ